MEVDVMEQDKKDAASKKEKLSVICDDSNKTENNKTPVDKVTEVNNENDSELKCKNNKLETVKNTETAKDERKEDEEESSSVSEMESDSENNLAGKYKINWHISR